MNHHIEAWEHVKKHLFGAVTEVTITTPWGFKEDREDINNISLANFLEWAIKTDTIVLHILSGEGAKQEEVEKAIRHANRCAVKVVILEHNHNNMDVPNTDFIDEIVGDCIKEDWGRNKLYAYTTMRPLVLNELSDDYIKEYLNKHYVTSQDEGVDTTNLVYTHTSESKIDFEIPPGIVYWVIGGGIAYESMHPRNTNILIDSVLKQVLHCAYLYNVEPWKLKRIWNDVDAVTYSDDYKQWRKVTKNGVQPDEIRHMAIQDLQSKGNTVYVSTVHKDYWKHLEETNNILDGWTNRDTITLRVV